MGVPKSSGRGPKSVKKALQKYPLFLPPSFLASGPPGTPKGVPRGSKNPTKGPPGPSSPSQTRLSQNERLVYTRASFSGVPGVPKASQNRPGPPSGPLKKRRGIPRPSPISPARFSLLFRPSFRVQNPSPSHSKTISKIIRKKHRKIFRIRRFWGVTPYEPISCFWELLGPKVEPKPGFSGKTSFSWKHCKNHVFLMIFSSFSPQNLLKIHYISRKFPHTSELPRKNWISRK